MNKFRNSTIVVAVSALLTCASLILVSVLVGPAARAQTLGPCSQKRITDGNACGKTAKCADTSCTTWFDAAPGLNTLEQGLPTDNWRGMDFSDPNNQVSCGSGGDCVLWPNGMCITLPGEGRYTNKIINRGACTVLNPL